MPKSAPLVRVAFLAMMLPTVCHAAKPKELVVEPPTLRCAGFHWEITGDHNGDASATIEFRKAGDVVWRKGLDFMRVGVGGHEFVAGSLFGLEPGTDYEARLTLVDPDGVEGEAVQIVVFTTRREPQPGALSDYNGFRLVPEVMQDKPFVFEQDQQFATLTEYAKASGMETHSILVPGYEGLFVNVPEPREDELYRLEGLDFRLKPGSPAIDAGTVIPNINEDYTGKAPDLGPLEVGQPVPHYGARGADCLQSRSEV